MTARFTIGATWRFVDHDHGNLAAVSPSGIRPSIMESSVLPAV
jgi:hypothetical protein